MIQGLDMEIKRGVEYELLGSNVITGRYMRVTGAR